MQIIILIFAARDHWAPSVCLENIRAYLPLIPFLISLIQQLFNETYQSAQQ